MLFFTAAVAETKRIPFDLPEGESELVAGYHVEYSGGKFLMFFAAEFAEIVTVAGLVTTLFFGGWQVPYLMRDGFHFPWGGTLLLPASSHRVAASGGIHAQGGVFLLAADLACAGVCRAFATIRSCAWVGKCFCRWRCLTSLPRRFGSSRRNRFSEPMDSASLIFYLLATLLVIASLDGGVFCAMLCTVPWRWCRRCC